MLVIKNLHVDVEGKEILKGVDLVVRPGDTHAIMGPNGSGKSTLAYALMGHPRYEVARAKSRAIINLDGKDLLSLSPDGRARLGLFLAFQYPVGVEGVSVQNFLRQAVVARNNEQGTRNNEQNVGNGGVQMRALEFRKLLLAEARKLGIKEELLRRSLNDGFSGGEKKRVEILQMAVLQPKYAILDETDSGLDIDALKTVALGIKRVTRSNRRMSVVLITHYQRILRFIKPDFVHVMIGGRIVKSGGRELAEELEEQGYKIYE